MAIDLTGISNVNEFYTQYYLQAVLEGDLKGVLEAWSKLDPTPPEALRQLARSYDSKEPGEDWWYEFFTALGYPLKPAQWQLADESLLPLETELVTSTGAPHLWIVQTPDTEDDPLTAFDEILTKQIFAAPEPPRWVILHSNTQIVLIDRTKWAQKRLLRFNLPEILGRREPSTLRATAALLHSESVAPESGAPLLDTLDENSHKHAFSVSEDLKYSAREAVELIGNEALWYLAEKHRKIYENEIAKDLTRECLRYLYRLLFLFYVEARPELGYAPMKSEEYRTGYSLEALRDIVEQGEFTTEESRNGYFLHESLSLLFRLIWNGNHAGESQYALDGRTSDYHVFRMPPLQGDLFDPARIPILSQVKFRNHVLQRVIELLSLSREGSGKRRGRISYRQLGINQLGAVYEGLLSYTGFVAKEDLYEVKRADEKPDPLKQAYFVSLGELAGYEDSEKVYDEAGRVKCYPRRTFIYRLSGRDRQKSASYYTPEVLTKCVVKYALKELLGDITNGKTADQILELTVCEPAMGSGAFLNEAINQLADAYLERKQRETGVSIAHDEIEREKQKVKAWLASNRVFGVDRNPVAIELAQISLWLNTMYREEDANSTPQIPWFGAQLAVGNSLIGARRQVFRRSQIEKSRDWLEAEPERVPLKTDRPADGVYHWLLPDSGMADYTDSAIRQMTKPHLDRIKVWRKEFTARYDRSETETLLRLSAAADRLWARHADELRDLRAATAHVFPVFGNAFPERNQKETTASRDRRRRQTILSEGSAASSPYRRLRMAMDYWCALWFWPIEQADLMPSRHEFLLEMSLLLEGTGRAVEMIRAEQGSLLPEARPEQQALAMVSDYGIVNVDALTDAENRTGKRLRVVRDVGRQHRFLHWDLEFADVFRDRGGFDLIVGNPPWIKVEWNEGAVIGDIKPLYAVRSSLAPQLAKDRPEVMARYPALRQLYLDEYVEFEGTQQFLNARQNYSLLRGTQSNTYKCFITLSTTISTVAAFVHDDGMFNDPKGGLLREHLYPRLRYWFQFENEIPLFEGLNDHGRMRFEVSILGPPKPVAFDMVADVFWPATIDRSYEHDGKGPAVEGRKNDLNNWSVTGHKDRILRITARELELFAALYDTHGTPSSRARLPVLRAQELVGVLRKIAVYPERLETVGSQYRCSTIWDETNAVKKDRIILRKTWVPSSANECIFSGPHISVANPRFKMPYANWASRNDYSLVDLTALDQEHIPRCNFMRDCDVDMFRSRLPALPWNSEKRITDNYRLVSREMVAPDWERTLLAAILPPGISHINVLLSTAFEDSAVLLRFAAGAASLPVDFRVKTTGMGHINKSLLEQLPVLAGSGAILIRTLLLNCLTQDYADLWRDQFEPSCKLEKWTKPDPRLDNAHFSLLTDQWSWQVPLRTDYARPLLSG